MQKETNHNNLAIILVEPQGALNIGSPGMDCGKVGGWEKEAELLERAMIDHSLS